jgi:hypothetical protein
MRKQKKQEKGKQRRAPALRPRSPTFEDVGLTVEPGMRNDARKTGSRPSSSLSMHFERIAPKGLLGLPLQHNGPTSRNEQCECDEARAATSTDSGNAAGETHGHPMF